MNAAAQIPRYFSQHPEDVARRKRAYLEAIAPLQAELARLFNVYQPPKVWFVAAGSNEVEDMSPPWEDGLPPEVRQHAENVRDHIARTAREYGFEGPAEPAGRPGAMTTENYLRSGDYHSSRRA